MSGREPRGVSNGIVEAYLNGERSMKSIAQAHDITHALLMIWVDKYRCGELVDAAILPARPFESH
jgi:transposase-like protein